MLNQKAWSPHPSTLGHYYIIYVNPITTGRLEIQSCSPRWVNESLGTALGELELILGNMSPLISHLCSKREKKPFLIGSLSIHPPGSQADWNRTERSRGIQLLGLLAWRRSLKHTGTAQHPTKPIVPPWVASLLFLRRSHTEEIDPRPIHANALRMKDRFCQVALGCRQSPGFSRPNVDQVLCNRI